MSPRGRRRLAIRWYTGEWRPYVPVDERRRQAAQTLASMRKLGRGVSPVEISGRKIATTFWGEAWCRNLESYSDYANRLPRGRRYVRNGSVVDLEIQPGRVRAIVSGSSLYDVEIKIKPLARARWTGIKALCAGQIDSLIELLRGSISRNVMEIVARKDVGLFPSPLEIALSCSCPDWATMCKHVAATLYGVGARLDQAPELLFTLRGVAPAEMVEATVTRPPFQGASPKSRILQADELSSVFGIDIDSGGATATSAEHLAASGRRPGRAIRKKGKEDISGRKSENKSKKKTTVRTRGARANRGAQRSTKKRSTKKKRSRSQG